MLGEAGQQAAVSFYASPVAAVTQMLTVKLLSTHADDEQTLDEVNTLLVVRSIVRLRSVWLHQLDCAKPGAPAQTNIRSWLRRLTLTPCVPTPWIITPAGRRGCCGQL